MKWVCVFCGANSGSRPEHAEAARRMGEEIARRGRGLVFGGGRVGLMGVIADAALAAGAPAVGVIPEALATKELAHDGLTEIHVVRSMHERKALMAERSDAFVALPGGFGTLEEFFEVLTWAQLGFHAKPCGLLDVAGYFGPLQTFFDHAVDEGFLRPEHRGMVVAATDPARLLDALDAWTPPPVKKWIGRSET